MSKLKCPKCGNEDPEKFEFCEWIPSYRDVLGLTEDGRLIISQASNDFWEGAERQHFYCRNDCDAEIPWPEGLQVTYDYDE